MKNNIIKPTSMNSRSGERHPKPSFLATPCCLATSRAAPRKKERLNLQILATKHDLRTAFGHILEAFQLLLTHFLLQKCLQTFRICSSTGRQKIAELPESAADWRGHPPEHFHRKSMEIQEKEKNDEDQPRTA